MPVACDSSQAMPITPRGVQVQLPALYEVCVGAIALYCSRKARATWSVSGFSR